MLLALSALAVSFRPASGAWATFGNQAATAALNQVNAQAISDGAGGMIVVWQDFRTGTADIYAQRFDASGNKLWGDGGVAVCTETNHQETPVLVSDGSGGAVIAWQDLRSGAGYDIWAQAVTSGGTVKWASGGVAICTASGAQVLEVITTDAAGGAIIAWRDSRGVSADVYAQRVRSTGATVWTLDGVAVCTATGQQNDISIVSDGQKGAYLAWRDPRNGSLNNDIYAQALDSLGVARWTANGVVVSNAAFDQIEPMIAYDGNFGLLVTWQDARNGTDYDIFAQRIRPDGTPRWTPNGVQACDVDSSQSVPLVVTDGARGAIVAWTDTRTSIKWPDIYAQRFDSSGVALWPANGVAVCAADSGQFLRTMIPDKSGGAILGWDDERGAGNDEDLYAQGISSAGAIRWIAAGVKIGTGSGTRRLTSSAPDGYGGALFAWEDFRNGATTDVFGLRLTSVGTGIEPASAPPAARLLTPYPNPFNPHTTITFTLAEPSRFTLSIHDVQGRLVRSLASGDAQAGTRVFHWDGTRNDGTACASGAYFAVLSLPTGTRSTPLRLVR